MKKATAKEILRERSLDRLIEAYYEEYVNDNRLPELFEMIEPDTLCEWLMNNFLNDFSRSEIARIFEWEDDYE